MLWGDRALACEVNSFGIEAVPNVTTECGGIERMKKLIFHSELHGIDTECDVHP